MSLIIKLSLPVFLLVVLLRIIYINKEKKQMKIAMEHGDSENKARHYQHLVAFQMVMYSLAILAVLFFIYLVWLR